MDTSTSKFRAAPPRAGVTPARGDPLAPVFEGLKARRRASLAGLSPGERHDLGACGVRFDGDWAHLDDDVGLLSATAVRGALDADTAAWLRELDLRAHIDSTNTALLARAADASIAGCVLAAEVQTAGRGRRGRTWLSPFGRNLAVSLGIGMTRRVAELGAVSLVVGGAVRAALGDCGVSDVELKWPNDVLLEGRKLAGILIELVRAVAPVEVVVGIGVNVGGAAAVAQRVEQSVADVAERIAKPSRNALLAAIVKRVVAACQRFDAEGFAPFRREWEQAHPHQGAQVTVTTVTESVSGTALGVAEDGSLRVRTATGIRAFSGGEVTLRETAP